jgi:hypothetical protein
MQRYVPKALVIRYLEEYAASFDSDSLESRCARSSLFHFHRSRARPDSLLGCRRLIEPVKATEFLSIRC